MDRLSYIHMTITFQHMRPPCIERPLPTLNAENTSTNQHLQSAFTTIIITAATPATPLTHFHNHLQIYTDNNNDNTDNNM